MSQDKLTAVKMPKWGIAMTSGKLVGWLKKEGESVQTGDEILEVETDKTVNVLEAAATGTLVRRVAEMGRDLPVGALLCVIAQGDVDDAAIDAFVAEFEANFVPEDDDEVGINELHHVVLDNDVTIAYRQFPAAEPGDGVPVLLIHGFGGDQSGWALTVPTLADNRTLYTLDLPGHGASSKNVADGSLPALNQVLSAFMDALGIARAHLIGHSLGASVAATLATTIPKKIATLTLIGGLGAGTEVDRDYVDAFLAADRRKPLTECMRRLFADPAAVNRTMIEDVLKTKRLEGVTTSLTAIAEAAIFAVVDVRPEQALAGLDVPVQVIWGRGDSISPANQLTCLPPNIPCHIVENAGHMVHIEAAAKVNHVIRSFLESEAVQA